MSTVALWVPVVWMSDPEGGWGPDVPPEVSYSAEIPSELNMDLPVRSKNGNINGDKHLGDPAVSYCRVYVDEKDKDKVTSAISESSVPEEDRILINMCAIIHEPWGIVAEQRVAKLFDDIPGISSANSGRKAKIKGVLIHAVLRGLSAEKAEEVLQKHGLPQAVEKHNGH